MDWEFGVGRCKQLHLEWISNKVLLYSIGNYSQSPIKDHDGKEHKKEYVWEFPTVAQQKQIQLGTIRLWVRSLA